MKNLDNKLLCAASHWNLRAASARHVPLNQRGFGLPSGYLAYLRCIYSINIALLESSPIFLILAGALQGCPLSGWIFAVSTTCFVQALDECVDKVGFGMSRVCADDIGLALKEVRHLKTVHAICHLMDKCAVLCV